jgi:hypothetical protein
MLNFFPKMSRLLFSKIPWRIASHGSKPSATRSYAVAPSSISFDWQDPLNSSSLLTEDEIAIAETAEKYCQEQLLPRVLREFPVAFPYEDI